MKIMAFLTSAVALLFVVPVAAQTGAPSAPNEISTAPAIIPNYANPANWLCLPGRDDACSKPLPTTALNANGYGSVGQAKPAPDPPVDCFYVYPTVSRDAGDNSDLIPGVEEHGVAAVQLARFSGVCRTFAPLYRQATLASLLRAITGAGPPRSLVLPYQDLVVAWRHYLRNYNKGRPFVVIGHSQGSIHLSQLLAREIETSPEAARMLSAMLIGYNIQVPEGKLVGGTFKKTPLCTRVGETGCVVTFVSFRAGSPPPPGSIFGRASAPGMTVGCTNPARFVRGPAPLDSYWYAGPSISGAQSPIAWSSAGVQPTTFLRTNGLVSGACVNDGPLGYLAITVNADPNDARTDRIPGDVVIGGAVQPGWGLHLADMSLAMGDLMALIEEQSAAFRARAARR